MLHSKCPHTKMIALYFIFIEPSGVRLCCETSLSILIFLTRSSRFHKTLSSRHSFNFFLQCRRLNIIKRILDFMMWRNLPLKSQQLQHIFCIYSELSNCSNTVNLSAIVSYPGNRVRYRICKRKQSTAYIKENFFSVLYKFTVNNSYNETCSVWVLCL